MNDEQPLYLRVAAALGWTDIRFVGGILSPQASHYDGRPPRWLPIIGKPEEGRRRVPRFDLEWVATGPVMVDLRIGIMPTFAPMSPPLPGTLWIAKEEVSGIWSDNPDPLHAVCEVILMMAEAGVVRG